MQLDGRPICGMRMELGGLCHKLYDEEACSGSTRKALLQLENNFVSSILMFPVIRDALLHPIR